MDPEPAGAMPIEEARERAEKIRSAVELEHPMMVRAVERMVVSIERGRDRGWARQRAVELVNEAVARALARPGSYDPTRSAVHWIAGIARNVMKGEARAESGRPRRADLDENALEAMLVDLHPNPGESSDHLRIERMLSRLPPGQREAIVSHYLRGLSGKGLVEALGVPSLEAARGRVFRALHTLRDLYAQDGQEVDR